MRDNAAANALDTTHQNITVHVRCTAPLTPLPRYWQYSFNIPEGGREGWGREVGGERRECKIVGNLWRKPLVDILRRGVYRGVYWKTLLWLYKGYITGRDFT